MTPLKMLEINSSSRNLFFLYYLIYISSKVGYKNEINVRPKKIEINVCTQNWENSIVIY
jgi:hypothetical protein